MSVGGASRTLAKLRELLDDANFRVTAQNHNPRDRQEGELLNLPLCLYLPNYTDCGIYKYYRNKKHILPRADRGKGYCNQKI